MSRESDNLIQKSLVRLLRPVVRMMLRMKVPYGVFVKVARHVFVDIAREELEIPGKKLSHSRIAIVTGIPRNDIKKLMKMDALEDREVAREHNRAARVVTGWLSSPGYRDSVTDKPLDLRVFGEGPSLEQLVHDYSGGVPVKAVLDELLLTNAVRELNDGKVRLVSYGYIPRGDELSSLYMGARDASELLNTVHHNITEEKTPSFLQLSARCDNLPQEALEQIREESARNGRDLLDKIARILSRYDRDQREDVFGTGKYQAGIGVYYFEEDLEDERST